MWKRKIGFGFLLLLLSLRWLSAQPLRLQELDTPTLLKEAASKIQELMILNEDLKEEAKESLELSKNLEIQLEILNSERETLLKDIENLKARLESLEIRWAESERLRTELTDALRISEASWKSYRDEVEVRIRKEKIKGIIIGLGAGMMIGMVVGIAIK